MQNTHVLAGCSHKPDRASQCWRGRGQNAIYDDFVCQNMLDLKDVWGETDHSVCDGVPEERLGILPLQPIQQLFYVARPR